MKISLTSLYYTEEIFLLSIYLFSHLLIYISMDSWTLSQFNELQFIAIIICFGAPIVPDLVSGRESLQAGTCVLLTCPHYSLTIFLPSGKTRCSKFIVTFPTHLQNQPLLQGALVYFSGEWYL